MFHLKAVCLVLFVIERLEFVNGQFMEFVKVFDVSISDDKAEKIQTVGDAVKYIEDNIKQ